VVKQYGSLRILAFARSSIEVGLKEQPGQISFRALLAAPH
jgi:hypothetical protein